MTGDRGSGRIEEDERERMRSRMNIKPDTKHGIKK